MYSQSVFLSVRCHMAPCYVLKRNVGFKKNNSNLEVCVAFCTVHFKYFVIGQNLRQMLLHKFKDIEEHKTEQEKFGLTTQRQ